MVIEKYIPPIENTLEGKAKLDHERNQIDYS